MKMNRWRSVVAVVCCVVISGCTTSRWVTDSRKEVIPEDAASTVAPILSITQYPEDKPEVIVKLSKRLVGTFEVQEQQHEVIHTVWGGNRINDFYGGLLVLPFSPLALVYHTVDGQPKKGLMAVVNSFLAATGFNAFPGSAFYKADSQTGESRINKMSNGMAGAQEIPWGSGAVDVVVEGRTVMTRTATSSGVVTVNLKSLGVNISHPTKDLDLKISAEAGGSTAAERVTVTIPTMLAWPLKEAEYARREQEKVDELVRQDRERKAQEEREAIAKREREAQIAREAEARREYERQHPEIVAARKAKEAAAKREQARQEAEEEAERKAESDANMALMMQGIGMLGQIAAAQQQQKSMTNIPPVSMPRSLANQQTMAQALQQVADGSSPSESHAAGGQTSQPRCEHKEGRGGFIAKCNCEGGSFRETYNPSMKNAMGQDINGARRWSCNKGGQVTFSCVAIKELGRERCLFN